MTRALPASYTETFLELLDVVASSHHAPEKLSVFWPDCGARYTGALLVVGRAADTWYRPVELAELRSESRRRAVLDEKRRWSEEDRLGDFVAGWNTSGFKRSSRSGFWRTVCATAGRLGLGSGPESLLSCCYTNLFKISGEKGNPSVSFRSVEIASSIELLRKEVAVFNPHRVLVISGHDWFHQFAKGLALSERRLAGGYVSTVIEDGDRRWVVAERPDSRRKGLLEADWVERGGEALSV